MVGLFAEGFIEAIPQQPAARFDFGARSPLAKGGVGSRSDSKCGPYLRKGSPGSINLHSSTDPRLARSSLNASRVVGAICARGRVDTASFDMKGETWQA
jgi:hypothetical protein